MVKVKKLHLHQVAKPLNIPVTTVGWGIEDKTNGPKLNHNGGKLQLRLSLDVPKL